MKKIDIFRKTYQNAKDIVRVSESDLKNGANGYLNQIKGYEQYKSPSLLSPQDHYWYFGQPIKYLGSGDTVGLNVWEDVLSVDNYFFGLVTCNQIEQMLEQGVFTYYFWGGRVNCTP